MTSRTLAAVAAALALGGIVSHDAAATPITLTFDYSFNYRSTDAGVDQSRAGEAYSGWVTFDTANSPSPQLLDGYLEARSKTGCAAWLNGVCTSDFGNAPSVVLGFHFDGPYGGIDAPVGSYVDATRFSYLASDYGQWSLEASYRQADATTTYFNLGMAGPPAVVGDIGDLDGLPNLAAVTANRAMLFWSQSNSSGSYTDVTTVTTLTATQVPEPGTMGLLLLGLVGITLSTRAGRRSPVLIRGG